MKLDDFLKCKKVRCVKGCGRHLTVGETYCVLGLSVPNNLVQVENDNGFITEYDFEKFEPVLDSAENPLQDMELTPETEASEPKFKAGDKVYLFGTNYIEEITKIIGANVYLAGADFDASVSVKEICHANPENYERLQATFPGIEFEQPPKPDAVERLTLIEKLEQEVNRLLELKAQEKPHSLGYVFLGHHIAATVNAINIVKQHEAESEVQDD